MAQPVPPWTYAQDAFWEWFQTDPAFAQARQQIPQPQGSGRCALCGRETDAWIAAGQWKTFTDWTAFRSPGAGLCPPCWAAKAYGHNAAPSGLAMAADGRPLNGRSYSLLIAKTASGLAGAVPWTGSWWDIPADRPLVAQIVRGDLPSRQHWIFHADVSANPETVALLVNGERTWIRQTQIEAVRRWLVPLLADPVKARDAVPRRAEPLSTLPWTPWFADLFPVSPVLSPYARTVLASLVKRALDQAAAPSVNPKEDGDDGP